MCVCVGVGGGGGGAKDAVVMWSYGNISRYGDYKCEACISGKYRYAIALPVQSSAFLQVLFSIVIKDHYGHQSSINTLFFIKLCLSPYVVTGVL